MEVALLLRHLGEFIHCNSLSGSDGVQPAIWAGRGQSTRSLAVATSPSRGGRRTPLRLWDLRAKVLSYRRRRARRTWRFRRARAAVPRLGLPAMRRCVGQQDGAAASCRSACRLRMSIRFEACQNLRCGRLYLTQHIVCGERVMRERFAPRRRVMVDFGSVALRRMCSMCEAEPCVADTYDDGPSDGGTDPCRNVDGVQRVHVQVGERERASDRHV